MTASRKFPSKNDVLARTPDPAVREMLVHLEQVGINTSFDRFDAQKPHCGSDSSAGGKRRIFYLVESSWRVEEQMKVRDSGMPEEEMWSGFFNPDKVLATLGLDSTVQDMVEFGCGYGNFTLAAARIASGSVHALDIEQEMVSCVARKCRENGIANVQLAARDFVTDGTGLADDSMDAALLFNILHHEEPVALMKEALRVLKPNGILAVIHWNYDPATPRGPEMNIRPQPEQCIGWGKEAGFHFSERNRYDLPPYHYGLIFKKPFPK